MATRIVRIALALGLAGTLAASCSPKPQEAQITSAAGPVAAAAGAVTNESRTLNAIRAARHVTCGVQPGLPGFATRDLLGQWKGFDVDFCRAVAAAVLGDARAVRYVPLTVKNRFTTLQAGQIDLLARAGGWTFTRDAGLGLDFAGISYYDGQGFLTRKRTNIRTAADLGTGTICVQAGTNNEANLVEHLRAKNLKARSVVMETEEETWAAYRAGGCTVLSGNIATLTVIRAGLDDAAGHIILPDVIAKEPQGPVVRQDDPQWADVVRWVLNAMILAEELGVGSRNVETARDKPASPEVERLLKGDGYGELLGLRDDWAFQVIRQVGAYGEVFDRHIGPKTQIGLDRGLNALWNAERPGLLYAPPMR